MDSTNINLTSYFSNLKGLEKKEQFPEVFSFLWKCDCNSTGEFSKLKSHNKALYANVVSPEVQPTSKACLRQKLSSKHRKEQMITRGKSLSWIRVERNFTYINGKMSVSQSKLHTSTRMIDCLGKVQNSTWQKEGKNIEKHSIRINAGVIIQSKKQRIGPNFICLYSEKNRDKCWFQNGSLSSVILFRLGILKKTWEKQLKAQNTT